MVKIEKMNSNRATGFTLLRQIKPFKLNRRDLTIKFKTKQENLIKMVIKKFLENNTSIVRTHGSQCMRKSISSNLKGQSYFTTSKKPDSIQIIKSDATT